MLLSSYYILQNILYFFYSEAEVLSSSNCVGCMEKDPENEMQMGEGVPDRPLECSECRKSIAVHYTEIERGKFSHLSMCNDCPELQKKLRGSPALSTTGEERKKAGLLCGECGTSLEEIRVGHSLGCQHCYEVFSDTIIYELYSMGKLPEKFEVEKKSAPLHIGRAPGESLEVNPSLKLIALNEALSETLKREDYEQAALIRDQINALTEEKESEEGVESDEQE